MKTEILNGDDLWNPYEGLRMAVKLMSEVKRRIEAGHLEIDGLGQNPAATVEKLIAETRSLEQTVQPSLMNVAMIKAGKNVPRIRVEITDAGKAKLKRVRSFISEIEEWHKTGKFPLIGTTVEFPGRYYEFSPQGQLNFAARSIAQCLTLVDKGFFEPPEDAYVPFV